MKIIYSILSILIIFPHYLYAASPVTDYDDLMVRIIDLVDVAIPIMLGFTVLFTAYQGFLFIMSGSDTVKRNEAKNGMGYGIVALFVMISVWGLVFILINSFFDNFTDYEAADNTRIPQLTE